jgi:subtilisin family serine protease
MKRTALLAPWVVALAAALGLSALPAAAAETQSVVSVAPATGEAIRDRYIVTLRDGADARGLARAARVSPRFVYSSAVNGFAAVLAPGQLRVLQRSPDVASIERDQVVHSERSVPTAPAPLATQSVSTGGGLYGLDRIDQRYRPLSGGYTYNATGAGVYVYVIDTGIDTGHKNFGGRARNVFDALGGNGKDCNGHGTHVAGTIGASTYGVAKGVQLRGVRVLDCDGSGSLSGIIAAVDWVRANATRPAVANISLGGGYSWSLNTAVTNLANSGVAVAVAAGNEDQDACGVSPASASGVLSVAASNKTDARASFSNYGRCVDLYAPGVGVRSTWLNGRAKTISGTSMASPHVAGVMALYKAYGDASTSEVNSALADAATTSVIRYNRTGTPNRLLYKGGL